MRIDTIFETTEVKDYLVSRQLISTYKKAKTYLLNGLFQSVNFKLRKPKENGIYYFRITKKYRAFCILVNHELRVFHIDDHQ